MRARPEPEQMIERVSGAALAIALLVTLAILKHQQDGSPPHMDVVLPGIEPATLYPPGPSFYAALPLTPPPPDKRSRAVVLAHGYAGDRLTMARLARRMALNGHRRGRLVAIGRRSAVAAGSRDPELARVGAPARGYRPDPVRWRTRGSVSTSHRHRIRYPMPSGKHSLRSNGKLYFWRTSRRISLPESS